MGKVKNCAGKEGFQRMNYLYQVSNFLACKDKNCCHLSSEYLKLMLGISKKTVQRLDIDVKRSICKQCRSPQIPGVNCKVRVKRKQIKWTCLTCNKIKVFKIQNPNYVPWTLTEEAVVEILDYKLNDD